MERTGRSFDLRGFVARGAAASLVGLAVWRCLRGAPASASRTDSTQAPLPSRAGLSRGAGTGAAGDMSPVSAYLATVLRLSPSLLAISALGTPSASIARMSLRVSWDTAVSPVLPGALF